MLKEKLIAVALGGREVHTRCGQNRWGGEWREKKINEWRDTLESINEWRRHTLESEPMWRDEIDKREIDEV